MSVVLLIFCIRHQNQESQPTMTYDNDVTKQISDGHEHCSLRTRSRMCRPSRGFGYVDRLASHYERSGQRRRDAIHANVDPIDEQQTTHAGHSEKSFVQKPNPLCCKLGDKLAAFTRPDSGNLLLRTTLLTQWPVGVVNVNTKTSETAMRFSDNFKPGLSIVQRVAWMHGTHSMSLTGVVLCQMQAQLVIWSSGHSAGILLICSSQDVRSIHEGQV